MEASRRRWEPGALLLGAHSPAASLVRPAGLAFSGEQCAAEPGAGSAAGTWPGATESSNLIATRRSCGRGRRVDVAYGIRPGLDFQTIRSGNSAHHFWPSSTLVSDSWSCGPADAS